MAHPEGHDTAAPPDEPSPAAFRLGYVPGATPAKWARTWQDRRPDRPLALVPVSAGDAADALRSGALDVALLRLPAVRDRLHVVALYEEVPVVVVGVEHVLAALEPDEEVDPADLADEVLLQPADDVLDWSSAGSGVPGREPVEQPATTALAIELVAAGVGVVVVPKSLARLHHRKDVTYRPVGGAPVAPVALAWPTGLEGDAARDADDFFGIVKGRTAQSSRGRDASAGTGSAGAGSARDGAAGSGTAGRGAAGGGRSAAPKRSAQADRQAAAARKAAARTPGSGGRKGQKGRRSR
ncbi:LysR substrate-binding domain-containing protein [Luteimicrobium subarcticum]|uniref:LysR substrate binding domain-containing protein n=1 Tax=Luteimicrobium subarcticum TaxID=620910 RepID=A0A2M8WT90_9MICO|nr:LysR substrate-binding domain-containing protein [Luteimicrobium subarcticum]PJI94162.1 LysR substrate binding domain-containing protein [Luteimicrobium subarcticum]